MREIKWPICDVRPGDQFERYKSNKTGSFLVYRYRRVHGEPCSDSLLVATFSCQADATAARNFYRKQEERIRTENDFDARRKVWAGLESTRMEAVL